jgi:hypothetical protein
VDGEMIMHGTGSEDYFNVGWYAFIDTWDTKMSLQNHGSLDYSLHLCRKGGYSLFLLDKIPFTEYIPHSIEHGPVGNALPVDYTSVALYYCDSPDPVHLDTPANKPTTVYMPDTLIIYLQLMSYDVWDNIRMESMRTYNSGGLSYVYTINDESKLRISLKDIPADTYNLYLDLVKIEEGCDFSIWQRQTQVSGWFKTQKAESARMEDLFICCLEVGDFKNTMTFRFKTDELRDKLFLNRMILIRSDPANHRPGH